MALQVRDRDKVMEPYTMGAAAVAGLLGPLVDVGNAQSPGAGHAVALTAAALASLGAAAVVRRTLQPAAP